VKYLSEDIGYRTVDTLEHALADKYMVAQAEEVKKNCEKVVADGKVEGSWNVRYGARKEVGATGVYNDASQSCFAQPLLQRFDIMGKHLYKTCVDLTNIVVRVSDGAPEGKGHVVLVNSHLDSTLASPGAGHDAISVGVMLECMHVLIETPTWSPKNAIIFREITILYLPQRCEVLKSLSFQPCRGIPAGRVTLIFYPTSYCPNMSHLACFGSYSLTSVVYELSLILKLLVQPAANSSSKPHQRK